MKRNGEPTPPALRRNRDKTPISRRLRIPQSGPLVLAVLLVPRDGGLHGDILGLGGFGECDGSVGMKRSAMQATQDVLGLLGSAFLV